MQIVDFTNANATVLEIVSELEDWKDAFLYVNGILVEEYNGKDSFTGTYDSCKVSTVEHYATKTIINIWTK